MTFNPLPAQGNTSWYPWATDVHNALNDPTSSAASVLRSGFVPMWAANVAVAAGEVRVDASGQNFLALYDSAGALLAQTADITTTLSGSAANTEIKVALASTVALTAGRVYAVCLLNWSAGTAPTLFAAKSLAGGTTNLGTPTAFPRSAQDSIARTAPVASKAITALSASQQSLMWAAIS